MIELLLCHHCGHWTPENPTCSRHMNEKPAHENCFLLDRISEEEYYRRAKIMGWASQERLF